MSRYQSLAEGCLKVDFNLEPLNTRPTTLHAHVVETAMYLNRTHRDASLMWMDTTSFPSSYGSCWNTFSSLTPSREQALGLASPNNALKSGELWHVWGTQRGQPQTPCWHLWLSMVSRSWSSLWTRLSARGGGLNNTNINFHYECFIVYSYRLVFVSFIMTKR